MTSAKLDENWEIATSLCSVKIFCLFLNFGWICNSPKLKIHLNWTTQSKDSVEEMHFDLDETTENVNI